MNKGQREVILAGIRTEREGLVRDYRIHELVKAGRDVLRDARGMLQGNSVRASMVDEALNRLDAALWYLGEPSADPKELRNDPDVLPEDAEGNRTFEGMPEGADT